MQQATVRTLDGRTVRVQYLRHSPQPVEQDSFSDHVLDLAVRYPLGRGNLAGAFGSEVTIGPSSPTAQNGICSDPEGSDPEGAANHTYGSSRSSGANTDSSERSPEQRTEQASGNGSGNRCTHTRAINASAASAPPQEPCTSDGPAAASRPARRPSHKSLGADHTAPESLDSWQRLLIIANPGTPDAGGKCRSP